MIKYIEKGRAEGIITAPSSKSVGHRALICAAMCYGEKSRLSGLNACEDIFATLDCLETLGVAVKADDCGVELWGIKMSDVKPLPQNRLFCRESGSTMRFIIPLLWLTGNDTFIRGSERLLSRPMDVYKQIAEEKGFKFSVSGNELFTKGMLKAGEYKVAGNISSQFITGLLFALSTLKDDSRIHMTTDVESRGYIDITIDVMKDFGVHIVWEDDRTLYIKGGQKYTGRDYTVEGDWSNAAFLEAFNCIGGDVRVSGLNEKSYQPDRIYREHFDSICHGFCQINLENCPDLGPILFTLAAAKDGARFIGTRRLSIKESDRINDMKVELEKFGANIEVEENVVTVKKSELHAPTERLYGHNDHRIVMSLTVLSSIFGGEIEGCEAVSKSYPTFFEDAEKLGIKSNETH